MNAMDEEGIDSEAAEDEQLAVTAFALQKVSCSATTPADTEIVQRLESFTKKYEQMSADIGAASRIIQKSSLYAEGLLRTAVFFQCRKKLHNIHQAMRNVDGRVLAIQQKLNNIRRSLPQRKHSLVESGVFLYKCVYPGGVRYRDYPSTTAKIVGESALVAHNQVVEIAERVFIASEQSVFLHHKGVGWLFENKKDTVCFVRIPSPPAPQPMHYNEASPRKEHHVEQH